MKAGKLLGCALIAAWVASPAPSLAQTRRALVVGIDSYEPPPGAKAKDAGRWSNLDGAVNDARAVAALLRSRFGFEVRLLTDGQATRERILAELSGYLVEGAGPGDARVFYYAGHGSQVANSLSPEADKLDETLVPADAALGARDLRDKELGRLYLAALEKGAALTVILDSCHSGSGVRAPGRSRKLPADPRDVKDPTVIDPPEKRGALVLSAAQDYQVALETEGEGEAHGLFSWALIRALRSTSAGEPAERVFARVRALMLAEGRTQDPVLGGTAARLRAPLFGGAETARTAFTTVTRVAGAEQIVLASGRELGLRPGTVLQRPPSEGKPEGARLVVTKAEVGGAEARAEQPGAPLPAVGDLLEVRAWAPADEASLRLLVPSGPSAARLLADGQAVAALAKTAKVAVESEWASTPPCNVVLWRDGSYRMLRPDGSEVVLGESLTPKLAKALQECGGKLRVRVLLPAPPELAAALTKELGSQAVEVTADSARAHYQLAGRYLGSGLAYGWARTQLGPTDPPSPLPGETRAEPLQAKVTETAHELAELARSLARTRGWLTLEAPAEGGGFPYRLALRSPKTGAVLDRQTTVRDGDEYALALVRDPSSTGAVEPRWIYAFVIDSSGASQLLFPPSALGTVENHLPVAKKGAPPPEVIDLGDPFDISAPFGTDTFVLLATATPIEDLTVFESSGVRGPGEKKLSPLEELFSNTTRATRGVAKRAAPTSWSLDRLPMTSAAK